jgi:hypothetical protein
MGPLINFLVLMVFLFVGLAQAHVVSRSIGYGIAVPLAAVAMILAIVRYKQRKDRGE